MISYKPITQSQFWIQASPFQHYFTNFSGIKDTAGTSQYADGIRARIFNIRGPRTLSEVTVSAPFDPEKHVDIVDFWKAYGCEFVTLTITPVSCGEDPQPIGQRTITIPDAQITSLSFGQADRTSTNVATIELTFVMDTFTYN
jgi:hypothetical protein